MGDGQGVVLKPGLPVPALLLSAILIAVLHIFTIMVCLRHPPSTTITTETKGWATVCLLSSLLLGLHREHSGHLAPWTEEEERPQRGMSHCADQTCVSTSCGAGDPEGNVRVHRPRKREPAEPVKRKAGQRGGGVGSVEGEVRGLGWVRCRPSVNTWL